MRKIFLVLIFVLCNFAYAEDLKSVFGIDFGDKKADVEAALKENGWQPVVTKDKTIIMNVANINYFAVPFKKISLDYKDGVLWSYMVEYEPVDFYSMQMFIQSVYQIIPFFVKTESKYDTQKCLLSETFFSFGKYVIVNTQYVDYPKNTFFIGAVVISPSFE